MTDEENLGENFRCPSCFLIWFDPNASQIEGMPEKICEFCEKHPTGLILLQRQMDILEKASVADFPKFIRHLVSHLDLKP